MDIEIQAQNLEHVRDTVLGLIAEHTGQPLARIEADSLRDRWFTAEEARAYGLIDHVITSVDDMAARAAAAWSGWERRTDEQLHDPQRGREATDRRAGRWTSTAGCSATGSSIWAPRSTTAWPTWSSPSCCTWSPEDSDREIDLYLNSPGGSMTAMLAIYDTMQFIAAPVATTCVGQAASAAAVLLAAGAPGRRAILPHGRVLLHQPSTQGRGALPDLVLQAKEIVRVRAQMEEVLSRHTGQLHRAGARRHRPGQDLHRRGRDHVRVGRSGGGQPKDRTRPPLRAECEARPGPDTYLCQMGEEMGAVVNFPTPSAPSARDDRPAVDPLWRELAGGALRASRHYRGETLAQVAARAGVSVQYLSEVERGRKEPSSEILAAVVGALDLGLGDLLYAVSRRMEILGNASFRRVPSRIPDGPVALAA